MTKHTAEPWERNISAKYPIYAEVGGKRKFRHVASVLGGDEEAEANLRRIVACVNACAGISTEALETGALTALMRAADDAATPGVYVPTVLADMRSALAKLRGEDR